jgi:predicted nucleic acid-binding protein
VSVTLIDTNVLLDLVTDDRRWADWSIQQLDVASLRGELLINNVIYAQLSVRCATIETLETVLDEARLSVAAIPRAALFLAGKAFQRYSRRGRHTDRRVAGFLHRCARQRGWRCPPDA